MNNFCSVGAFKNRKITYSQTQNNYLQAIQIFDPCDMQCTNPWPMCRHPQPVYKRISVSYVNLHIPVPTSCQISVSLVSQPIFFAIGGS